jgi:hypothetical protein
MCERFEKDYPEDSKSPDELLKEHFPDAVIRNKKEVE